MKKNIVILSLLVIFSLACSMGGLINSSESATQIASTDQFQPTQSIQKTEAVQSTTQTEPSIQITQPEDKTQPCGDGVCEGPENAKNCPQDCTEGTQSAPMQAEQSLCALPNPQRAVVSEELLEFRNMYNDSSFEEGSAEVEILPPSGNQLQIGFAKRTTDAAHTGYWGYHVEAGPQQGVLFAAKGYVEKGEELHFSAWVRAPYGKYTLKPLIFWVEKEGELGNFDSGESIIIDQEWQQVNMRIATTIGAQYALFAFEIGPESTLYIDDVEIAVPFWRMASYPDGQGTQVGNVTVPIEPTALTHFNIVMHIEDPNLLQNSRPYFEEQTAIFTEMARIIHQHGGFLTIQPEQDWAQAAEGGFHPGLLAELHQQYGVMYSNHTHGPNCIDDQGLPRSSADCSSYPEWQRNYSDQDVIVYAQQMRELLSDASGTQVSDHNGNFDFPLTSAFADVGIQTLSVFKDRTTQSTYDRLINNPWRPAQVNALRDLDGFLRHDPDTKIVYIPGWGQALTRHPERVSERIKPMLSQFLRFADPQRVNSFYVVTHVSHFYSRLDDSNYLKYDPNSGEMIYSEEFLQHLAYWDNMLSEVS